MVVTRGRMEDCGYAPNAGRSAGRNDCACRAREALARKSGRDSLGVEFRAVESGWQHDEIVRTKREAAEQAHARPEI